MRKYLNDLKAVGRKDSGELLLNKKKQKQNCKIKLNRKI